MEQILKINDIVTLDNNKKYLVIHTSYINGEYYAMLTNTAVGDENNIQLMIAREILLDGDCELDLLTNIDEIEPILQVMQKEIMAKNEE